MDVQSRSTETESESSALTHMREETPSQPTGVRIDGNKLMMIHNEIIRVTEGFNVEKLERAYAILSKVGVLTRTFLLSSNKYKMKQ